TNDNPLTIDKITPQQPESVSINTIETTKINDNPLTIDKITPQQPEVVQLNTIKKVDTNNDSINIEKVPNINGNPTSIEYPTIKQQENTKTTNNSLTHKQTSLFREIKTDEIKISKQEETNPTENLTLTPNEINIDTNKTDNSRTPLQPLEIDTSNIDNQQSNTITQEQNITKNTPDTNKQQINMETINKISNLLEAIVNGKITLKVTGNVSIREEKATVELLSEYDKSNY
ncbi:MAG: hypothetical protein QXH92_04115, partial [Candidatus Aenigmatarchaeota archaeon]